MSKIVVGVFCFAILTSGVLATEISRDELAEIAEQLRGISRKVENLVLEVESEKLGLIKSDGMLNEDVFTDCEVSGESSEGNYGVSFRVKFENGAVLDLKANENVTFQNIDVVDFFLHYRGIWVPLVGSIRNNIARKISSLGRFSITREPVFKDRLVDNEAEVKVDSQSGVSVKKDEVVGKTTGKRFNITVVPGKEE